MKHQTKRSKRQQIRKCMRSRQIKKLLVDTDLAIDENNVSIKADTERVQSILRKCLNKNKNNNNNNNNKHKIK